MATSIIIVIIGVFIFLGHYLSEIFERKSIPDVLGLMLIGIFLGPVFHLVEPASFGKFGPLFSNFVLIFILFESGIGLAIAEIRESLKESAGITALGFFVTWIVALVLCKILFDLPWLACFFIGATIGGTSSAVVVGLVKKIAVLPKTATALIMESAESDVFTLAIPLGILGLMITGEIHTSTIISQFISSLVLALFIGIGGAFLWSFIVNKLPMLKTTKFSTPAFLFILYGIAEYLNFSGPLTALSFGIAIGNLRYFEPRILQRIIPDRSVVLPQTEKDFFGELVFLLRTFFFIFIGISIRIDSVNLLILGALLTLALFVARIFVVIFVLKKNTPILDKAVVSMMIPKGLGAAVIATLPFQQGYAYGEMIQSICFSVILFSTMYCVLLFFLLKTGFTMPFYNMVFGKDKI